MPLHRACAWLLLAGLIPAALADADYLSSTELRSAGLTKFWQLRLPLEAGQVLVDAYLVDDQLYLSTQDGYVYAVHADTGAIRWLRRVTGSGYRIKRPCHARGRTIFATPTKITQLDRLTGEGLAELDLRFPAGSGAVCDDERFYIGGINARFYAFDFATQYEVWKSTAGGPVVSTPVLFRDALFVASDDGGVYVCRAANKQRVWQASTTGPNTADVVVDERGVYVASRDQSLYLFDLQFGQVRWRARLSGPLYEAPVVTPEVAYQFCPDDGLVAVNTAVIDSDKRIRWKLPNGRALLTVDEQRAFVLSRDEKILIVSIADGQVRHEIAATGFSLAMPAAERTSLCLASPDGRLFYARAQGAPHPRREELRAALSLETAETGTAEPTTQPVAREPEPVSDMRRTRRTGTPVGGKSKVTRGLARGGG